MKFRVPISAIADFLLLLDPGENAMIEYKTGPNGEHYVVELDKTSEFLSCVDTTAGIAVLELI